MTNHNGFRGRNRSLQDSTRRHLYGEIVDVDGGGRVIHLRGNGTRDLEAVLLTVFGVGGKIKKDSDVEVYVLSSGSDVNLKFAIVLQDHTKERKWKEGTNGIQRMDDPGVALEFIKERTHVTDQNFAVGDGLFEIKDGRASFRIPVDFGDGITVKGEAEIENISTDKIEANHVKSPDIGGGGPGGPVVVDPIPDFDNSEGTPSS